MAAAAAVAVVGMAGAQQGSGRRALQRVSIVAAVRRRGGLGVAVAVVVKHEHEHLLGLHSPATSLSPSSIEIFAPFRNDMAQKQNSAPRASS